MAVRRGGVTQRGPNPNPMVHQMAPSLSHILCQFPRWRMRNTPGRPLASRVRFCDDPQYLLLDESVTFAKIVKWALPAMLLCKDVPPLPVVVPPLHAAGLTVAPLTPRGTHHAPQLMSLHPETKHTTRVL